MAKLLTDNFKFNGGYVDDLKTPYESISSVKNISASDRFEGLTVVVKSPIMMELWLVGGISNSYWKIKSMAAFNTYAQLQSFTTIMLSAIVRMISVGTTATVLEDETNGGKLTEYWITEVNTTEKTVTWSKKSSQGEGEYVPVDCVTGDDILS